MPTEARQVMQCSGARKNSGAGAVINGECHLDSISARQRWGTWQTEDPPYVKVNQMIFPMSVWVKNCQISHFWGWGKRWKLGEFYCSLDYEVLVFN